MDYINYRFDRDITTYYTLEEVTCIQNTIFKDVEIKPYVYSRVEHQNGMPKFFKPHGIIKVMPGEYCDDVEFERFIAFLAYISNSVEDDMKLPVDEQYIPDPHVIAYGNVDTPFIIGYEIFEHNYYYVEYKAKRTIKVVVHKDGTEHPYTREDAEWDTKEFEVP